MRFIAGARYRHDRCLDVDIEIIKVSYVGPRYTRASVIYLNRNGENGNFYIDSEKVFIYKEEYKHWRRI